MNFIGHATVALWSRDEPLFVLGSMLPDFASMARTRLAPATEHRDRRLAAGIALHHRTDDAFHAAPAFTGLCQRVLEELTARGVARGPARAVGHIGVEMLIDGELVQQRRVAEAYTAALEAAAARDGEAVGSAFRDPDARSRWEQLRRRLLGFGPPRDYREPDAVLARLHHVLASRPRLALDAPSLALVRARLPTLQREVVDALPELLASLRESLS